MATRVIILQLLIPARSSYLLLVAKVVVRPSIVRLMMAAAVAVAVVLVVLALLAVMKLVAMEAVQPFKAQPKVIV
jgi:hypothetical protein